MVRAKPQIIRSPNKTSFRIYLGRMCYRSVKGAGRAGRSTRKILTQDLQQPGPEMNKLPDFTTPKQWKKQIIVS